MPQPSPYWGDEVDLDQPEQRAQPDVRRARGACGSRPPSGRRDNPEFCKEGSSHPSAKLFPIERARPPSRRLRSEDEEAHAHQHLLRHAPPDVRGGREQHAVDERRRPGRRLAEHEDVRRDARRGEVAGLDRAHHRHQRQRQARRVRRAEPAGRSGKGQTLSAAAFYAVAPAPDGSIWGSVLGYPGAVVRLVPGANPPETALAEVYEPPCNDAATAASRRAAATSIATASYWAALASGHMASFDRRKCKGPLNGPTATGQHCPEGWTLYAEPLPQLKGVTDIGQRRGELLHVGRSVRHARPRQEHADRHRQRVGRAARAEGRQVGRAARAVSDGFYTKWMDGRIDDPNGGWKGRGLWTHRSARARRSTWRRGRGRRAR